MKIIGTLTAIRSERDRNGNTYWALRYLCHLTGKRVEGTVCGGESNINCILRHWTEPDGWDRSVLFQTEKMGKRDFQSLTKPWPYAGCSPEELAAFIRKGLNQ